MDQECESEPAHHARRPMNAFLIFCKRHRSVVRDKYPNLENRSITKILGEWWANLEDDEKACYTDLAREYKDAFFDAHPDFKWYKLPAPPLRTVTSRPRDSNDKHKEEHKHELIEAELERTNNNSTRVDLNKRTPEHSDVEPKPSMFTPGKLADEAQMGGLSSLLETKTETQNHYNSPNLNPISTYNDNRSHNNGKNDNIKDLQTALSETTRVFEEDFDENDSSNHYNNATNDQFTNQDVIDQIVDNRYSSDDYGNQRNSSDDERNARSGRSCKGKRYQEFMAVGGLIANKRQKRENSDKPEEYNGAAAGWDSGHGEDTNSSATDESKQSNNEATDTDTKDQTDAGESDTNPNKTFKAADFDLEAKIQALPSLSLEKFQQKKRDNKRKKKTVTLRPRPLEPRPRPLESRPRPAESRPRLFEPRPQPFEPRPTTSQARPRPLEMPIINSVPRPVYDERREMIENWRETVIGSQKRKPRKISITRLEVNSMVSRMEDPRNTSPEIKLAVEAPSGVGQSMPHGVELLALATLAEVAANTSKLEDSNMAAMHSEGNASMV